MKLQNVSCRLHPTSELVEDFHAGDLICKTCGMVVSDRVIDVGPEWRVFSDDTNDRSRVGQAEDALHGERSLQTRVAVDARRNEDHQSYARYQNRRMGGSSDQNLSKYNRELANMGERINLNPNVIHKSQMIFKRVVEAKAVKGRSMDDIMASCIYIACRMCDVPRSFKEICAVSKVNKREIGRCFKAIIRNLEMNIGNNTVQSGDFLSRFCSRLNLTPKTISDTKFINSKVIQLDLASGRSPISIAAASICLAIAINGVTPKYKEVSEITGCSDSTIRQLLKLLVPRIIEISPYETTQNSMVSVLKF